MTILQEEPTNGVTRYQPGEVIFHNGETYTSSVFLCNNQVSTNNVPDPQQLQVPNQHRQLIESCQKNEVEIVLIGTAMQAYQLIDIIEYYAKNKINLEVMQPGSACRTYNALISENRIIALLLYP